VKGFGARRIALVAVALCAQLSMATELPSFQQVRQDWRPSDAWLLDRHGRELQRVRLDDQMRRFHWTALADVSPALREALLASEDQRFFEHEGVDWQAALHAALGNVGKSQGQAARGASTITMQLAALLDPQLKRAEGGRSLAQKLAQARAALALEQRWSKAEILEAYLNLVSYRGELLGVAAMAHGLFGKAPHGLDRVEGAIAAALLRGPNATAQRVAERACLLLKLPAESAGAANTQKAQAPARICDGLLDRTTQTLARGHESFPRQDAAPHAARRLLAQAKARPGQRITSTIDGALQAVARQALRARLSELSGRNVEDGAVVVLDNRSGELLAHVGSSGGLSQAAHVDGAHAPRQAGSTLKPFLYALAIEEGRLSAASVLDDSPVQLRTDTGLYIPRDYANSYRGPVSVRASLAGSLNLPAVRTLLMVGPDRLVERLRLAGLDTLTESGDHYGYSLALGSADVTLMQLSNAYRMLANAGVWTPVVTGLAPLKAAVPVMTSAAVLVQAPRHVFGAQASHIVADILSDKAARASAFGLSNALETPFWSAVKTGTSKDMRDNWAIGFSARYTVGVWVGNASGSAMHGVSGVAGAAPIWRDVMGHLHRRGAMPSAAPGAPPGVVAQAIRYEPAIEAPRTELFIAGSERKVYTLASQGANAVVQARIAAPTPGSIIALDPDIPAQNQRLRLAATYPVRARWGIDGRTVGLAGQDLWWFPQPGRHRLTLHGENGELLDEATFEVRGATLKAALRR
jgi:penicillin-binding protein 1C